MGRYLLMAPVVGAAILAVDHGVGTVLGTFGAQNVADTVCLGCMYLIPVGCVGIVFNLMTSRSQRQMTSNKE